MYVTKPAGVFIQLIGAGFVLGAFASIGSGSAAGMIICLLVGFGCLWLGRQTKKE